MSITGTPGIGVMGEANRTMAAHVPTKATISNSATLAWASGATGVEVNGALAAANISNANISGFAKGVNVNAGSAKLFGSHVFNNTTGIRFTNGGSGAVGNVLLADGNNFDGATDN